MRNRNTAKESARRAREMARTERALGPPEARRASRGGLLLVHELGLTVFLDAKATKRIEQDAAAATSTAPATATAPVTAAAAQEKPPRFGRARRRVSP